jgi:hypothetical protein
VVYGGHELLVDFRSVKVVWLVAAVSTMLIEVAGTYICFRYVLLDLLYTFFLLCKNKAINEEYPRVLEVAFVLLRATSLLPASSSSYVLVVV